MTTTEKMVMPRSNPPWDVEKVRTEFPILVTRAHGKSLVYLDNGAATQKPRSVDEAGELGVGALDKFVRAGRVKMVSVNHVSNSLGTVNPVREMVARAHAAGSLVLIDGAQWVAHGRTDVVALDADFYAFSGHK